MDVKKNLSLQDIDPIYWVKVAHQFIDVPKRLLKIKPVPASIICNHIHIGVTQYLQLYLLVNDGTVEVVDNIKLITIFDKCLALDASFAKFQVDCEIIGTYSNEITCPRGMAVSMKDVKAAIKMGMRIESFVKSKIKKI